MFPMKNYSMLKTKMNESVLVNKTVCDPMILKQNQGVAFKVSADKDGGKLQAKLPFYRLTGQLPRQLTEPIGQGEYIGFVKNIQEHGDAFVECAEVKEKYGRDAYIHPTTVSQCQLDEGDGICFDVHPNKTGMPQVNCPLWKGCKQEPGSVKGEFDEKIYFGWVNSTCPSTGLVTLKCNHFGTVLASRRVVDPESVTAGDLIAFTVGKTVSGQVMAGSPIFRCCGTKQRPSLGNFGEYIGKVTEASPNENTKANHEKIYFVKCIALAEIYGREAWAHTTILSECGLGPGDVVCFKVHINAKGWPQLMAPVWKILSPQNVTCPWMRCDRIKPGCVQKPLIADVGSAAGLAAYEGFSTSMAGCAGSGEGGGGGAQDNFGHPEDWTCPTCADFQFGRNSHCRRCSTANPALPPELLDKGGKGGMHVTRGGTVRAAPWMIEGAMAAVTGKGMITPSLGTIRADVMQLTGTPGGNSNIPAAFRR